MIMAMIIHTILIVILFTEKQIKNKQVIMIYKKEEEVQECITKETLI